MFLQTRVISSLEKVFCSDRLDAGSIDRIALLRGETGAFQIACRSEERCKVQCQIRSRDGGPELSVRQVGLAPSLLPAMPDDPYIITSEPGLFPDPLLPGDTLVAVRGKWNAFWVTAAIPPEAEPGEYELEITLFCSHSPSPWPPPPRREFRLRFTVEILPAVLAPQRLKNTIWFHADCIQTYYGEKCWSKRHWTLLENYMRNLAGHGGNMLYTPLWSAPLDTLPGTERPTVQLLRVREEKGKYQFDFSRLEQWIRLAQSCGFRWFEFSHAFTQWGAAFTPKIVVETPDGEEKRFGWHVAADSPEYRKFLTALLPELAARLEQFGVKRQCYFHVSDEPAPGQLGDYRRGMELLRGLLPDFPIIDALSSPEFVRSGVCDCPIPCITEIDAFREFKLPERWIYYCGNYQDGLPNRQFGMPSARFRILGTLLGLAGIDGLLNWGYNFWYSRFSIDQTLNPWQDTDADRTYCGGGSFLVYPGKDGQPVDSIRFEVFREAMQDLRAIQMLKEKIGAEAAGKFIHDGLDRPITFHHYPRSAQWLLALRERINRELCR